MQVKTLWEQVLRGWGPDSGRWGRFMKAVKLFSDPTKTKNLQASNFVISVCIRIFRTHRKRPFSLRGIIRVNYARRRLVYEANL